MKHLYTVICLLVFLGIGSIGWGQSYNPINGGGDVSTKPVLSITFDSGASLSLNGGTTVAVSTLDFTTHVINVPLLDSRVTISDNVLSINLSDEQLSYSTTYLVYMQSGALTVNGASFDDLSNLTNPGWIFTTEVEPTYTLSPFNNESNVSITPTLSLAYQPIDNLTLENGYVITVEATDDSGHRVDLSTQGAGFPPAGSTDPRLNATSNLFTIDLSATTLNYNTEYRVIIPNGALKLNGEDVSDFSSNNHSNWLFTTVSPPAPVITAYEPGREALNVPVEQDFTLTFSENIQWVTPVDVRYININPPTGDPIGYRIAPGDITSYLEIFNNQLTIKSRLSLNTNTEYYITIPSGVIESVNGAIFPGLTDSPGADYRFTTEGVPVWTSGYPLTRGVNDQQVEIAGQSNKAGTYYFVVSNNATVPTAEQVKAGQDASGLPTVYASGSAAMDANLEFSQIIDISDHTLFTPETTLYVYVVATDGISLLDSEVGATSFTTVGGPVWASGYPLTANLSRDNVDIVGQTDQTGEYIYVVTTSSTVPTLNQIKNGLDHNGEAALRTNFETPGVKSSNVEFSTSLNIADIDVAPTTYYVYLVATYSGDLDSEIGITSFTTVERVAPTATFEPINEATGVSVSASIVVTYNEAIRNIDGSVIDNTNAKDLVNIPGFSEYSVTIDATKHILTITPNEPFAGSTTYSVVINPVEDWYGNEQTEVLTSLFTTSDFVTWNGSVSKDWSDPANWTGELVAGFNALIPESGITNWPDVITNTGYYVKDIVIEAGAELNISSTGNLLVTGHFIMVSSNAGKGNASLINNGTLNISSTNKVQIQQNVTSNPTKWMMISSPVVGATQANINCVGVVSEYDMNINEWLPIGANTQMDVARGYQSYSFENMVFSGSINNASSYNVNAIKTTHNGGFNLAGNPYPCSIDWNLVDIGTTGLLNAFWVYLNDSQQYGTYNGNAELGTNLSELGSSVIPSHHAFWVKVPDGEQSGTLTIPSSSRVHNTNTYLKSTKTDNRGIVRLVGVNGEVSDEAVIAFNSKAESIFDVHDTEKRFASTDSKVFEIFSLIDDKKLCINSFEELSEAMIIPIGVYAPKDGDYSIDLKEIKNFQSEIEVKLEDTSTETPTFIDLQEFGKYDFSIAQGFTTSRFNLHIQPTNDDATNIDIEESEQIQIYSNDNYIYINIPKLNNPMYQVFSVSGQVISNGPLVGNSINKVRTMSKGVVIVKVSSREGAFVKKVFVE